MKSRYWYYDKTISTTLQIEKYHKPRSPRVTISHIRMPKLQTSVLVVKREYINDSGAIHLIGNAFLPCLVSITSPSSFANLDIPKSAILHSLLWSTSTFLAARSRWMICKNRIKTRGSIDRCSMRRWPQVDVLLRNHITRNAHWYRVTGWAKSNPRSGQNLTEKERRRKKEERSVFWLLEDIRRRLSAQRIDFTTRWFRIAWLRNTAATDTLLLLIYCTTDLSHCYSPWKPGSIYFMLVVASHRGPRELYAPMEIAWRINR